MKRTILPLILFLFILNSCNKQNVNLSGIYTVGGFHTVENAEYDSIKKVITMFGDKPINFLDNDTVKLSSEFGVEFFKDSIFRYELTDDYLIFSNNNNRYEMTYKVDGTIFRLDVNHKTLNRLDWRL